MKKPLTLLSFFLATIGALGQGQVNFAARVVGLYDAPVYLCDVRPGLELTGSRYLVQLYAGPTQNSLAPIGTPLPFLTGADAGYWNAEARTVAVDANGVAFVQVRAWDTAFGSTYEAATASNGNEFGISLILSLYPTVSPDLPATLIGLESFTFVLPVGANSSCVPEPSVMLLAVLGSIPFFLRRQSNRR